MCDLDHETIINDSIVRQEPIHIPLKSETYYFIFIINDSIFRQTHMNMSIKIVPKQNPIKTY